MGDLLDKSLSWLSRDLKKSTKNSAMGNFKSSPSNSRSLKGLHGWKIFKRSAITRRLFKISHIHCRSFGDFFKILYLWEIF